MEEKTCIDLYLEAIQSNNEEKFARFVYKVFQETENVKDINEFNNIEDAVKYIENQYGEQLEEMWETKVSHIPIKQEDKNKLIIALDDVTEMEHYNNEVIEIILKNITNSFETEEIQTLLDDRQDIIQKIINNKPRFFYPQDMIIQLIKSTGNIEKYLKKCRKIGLDKSDILNLVGEDIYKYLTPEYCKAFELNNRDIMQLIEKSEKIDQYLEPELCKELGLDSTNITRLIIKSGNIYKHLTPEKYQAWGINDKQLDEIISSPEFYYNNENLHIIYDLKIGNHTMIKSKEMIYDNLDYILEQEGYIELKDRIERLYKINEDIISVDYKILEDKYINLFGEEKINLISCYPYIINEIITMDEKSIALLSKCLDNYENKTQNKEWTPLCNKILDNLNSYKDFIRNININELSEEQLELITKVLSKDNYFGITTIDEINDYENIKQQKCNELFEMDDISYKINAVLISKLGLSNREAKELEYKYGKCIEKIENEELKYFIKCLREINKVQNKDILMDMYNNIKPVENINTIEIERALKDEYGKLYYKDLFKLDDAEKNAELGENIYELPKDEKGNVAKFNMIITSIGAYVANAPDNFYKDWNRPSIASQHFCTSYIRRDMMATAPIPHLCYGFSDFSKDALMLSGSEDMYSSGIAFESTARHSERYLSPDVQIDETRYHNEMCFRRTQDGEKKQPDYIVIFRENNQIPNMQKAQKASKQFEEANGVALPIIIVDKDLCLETERRELDEMIFDFEKQPSSEKRKQILQKIANNRKTKREFAGDIDKDEYMKDKEMEQHNDGKEWKITEEDCKTFYDETTAEDRNKFINKFKQLYYKIQKEQEVEKNGEER